MDVRVIIIGHQVFAVEIRSQHAENARIDFRRSFADLEYAVHQLPREIEQKLLHLTRLFRLQYSSIDLVVSTEETLEQNPNEQFLWLAGPTGLPLAEAMANLLRAPQEYGLWK